MTAWLKHLPQTIAESEVDLLAGDTLPSVWVDRWMRDPQREVIHDPKQGWINGGTLLARSQIAARKLARAGVAAGDRVLISASSSVDLVVAHTAALRLGAIVMPTNGAYRADEVAHVVSDARPRVAIIEDAEWGEWIRAVDKNIVLTPPSISLDEGPDISLDAAKASHPALIGYTSGTTGRPKGAVLSHGNLLSSIRGLEIAWRWTSHDILILALPLFHMHGLGVGLHGSLAVGAKAVLLPQFKVDQVLNAISEFKATLFFGVPTMYSRIIDSGRANELDVLRLCVSGSAPLSSSLHESIQRESGQVVLERYGMTETAMLVSNLYEGARKAGSVGIPLPGVEIRLEGDASEIEVRGPNVFEGYWERPDANAEAFRDGWFRTGDLGRLDEDGYLAITGRAKELIISGGFNIYPREIEDVLCGHDAITECAVVGVADDEWGEAVAAFVVADRDIGYEEARDFVGRRLAHYKRPKYVRRVASLPKNALGKVQKHRLVLDRDN